MHMRRLIALTLAVTSVHAQSSAGVPPCGTACVNQAGDSAVTNNGCPTGRIGCYCNRGNFIGFITTCVNQQCTTETDINATIAYVNGLCAAAPPPPPGAPPPPGGRNQTTTVLITSLSSSATPTSTATDTATSQASTSNTTTAAQTTAVPDQSKNGAKESKGSSSSVAIAVGVAVGVVAIIAGLIIFWIWRRRRTDNHRPMNIQPIYEADASSGHHHTEVKEMEAPSAVYELPAQRIASPAMQHNFEWNFNSNNNNNNNHQHGASLSPPNVSPEQYPVSPIDGSDHGYDGRQPSR